MDDVTALQYLAECMLVYIGMVSVFAIAALLCDTRAVAAITCFWNGHKVPDEWLEYESELGGLSIPCERCDS